MAEWTVCSHCQLKHTPRTDGRCPSCGQPAAGGAADEAKSDSRATSRPAPELFSSAARIAHAEVPLGARVAGVILLLNALAIAIERMIMPSETGPLGGGASAVMDLVIGSMLVAGKGSVLTWAQVRAVLGAVVVTGLQAASGNTLMAFFQLTFSAGLLLLLMGEAGKVRIAAGVVVTGLFLALEGLGLVTAFTGANPIAQAVMSGELEDEPAGVVEGTSVPYRLTLPNDKWRLRKKDIAHRDNPAADRWAVRPDRDAHVIVIAERLQGEVDLGRFRDVVVENLKQGSTTFEMVEEARLESASGADTSYLLHTRRLVSGIRVEGYHALFVLKGNIYQVLAFTNQSGFPPMNDELKQVINAFQVRSSPSL